MSGQQAIVGLRQTWSLLWAQSLGRVVVVLFSLLGLIYLIELGSGDFRAGISVHIDRLLLPGMIVVLAIRTRKIDGIEERRFWNLLVAGMVIWFLGTFLYFTSYTFSLPRWVDLAVDGCYILLYLFWFLASEQQPQLRSGWSSGDVLFRYTVIGGAAFIAIMFGYFVVVPWVSEPAKYLQYFSSFNLYVTLDVLLTVKFGLLFLSSRQTHWRRCFALLAGATGVLAVGDLLEGLGFADLLDTVMGARIDILWLVPHFLLCVMILTCPDRSESSSKKEGERAFSIQSLLPFYAFALPLVHLGLYLLGHLDPVDQGPREAIVFFGLLFFAGLSLAQQVSLERAVASLRSDLTVRALDDKLRRSQRLEAIGRLAGGIAHDFNNLLMVIKSYAELAGKGLTAGNRGVRDKLEEIDRAADRAADLIRQLLAFGRRQVLRPEVVHVNEMVLGLEGMLSRIIGDDVELTVELDEDAGFTRVDPALLEQVIVNLAVNARDAMPRGGKLTIRTRSFDGPPVNAMEIGADRRSVELTVTDTGSGITPEVRERIFEPYFTTKEMEKGTGLGLATVYGIVDQSGGTIDVESSPGRGSTFRVRLLQVDERPTDPVKIVHTSTRSVAGETVLLTEDEGTIREALAEYLESLGIKVIQANDGVHALEVAEAFEGKIDVLITDLVMPRMSGPDLAARLLARSGDIKVIYVSGYTPEAMLEYGVSGDDAVFLQKPFLLGDLATTVREVLDKR